MDSLIIMIVEATAEFLMKATHKREGTIFAIPLLSTARGLILNSVQIREQRLTQNYLFNITARQQILERNGALHYYLDIC